MIVYKMDKALLVYCSSYLLILLNIFITNSSANDIILDPVPSPQKTRVPCPDVEHVCASLMKTGDVITVEDGDYCACPSCANPKWKEDDGKSLTWYHYERNDWLVQYKFCEKIMPKYECREPSEVAAVITTDASGWNLRIKKLFCYCPKHRHYLHGWNLSKDQQSVDTWDYHYVCDREQCDVKKPCVKHYIKEMKTIAYKFPCTCPEGFTCDTNKPITDKYDGKDNAGSFITGYCKEQPGNKLTTVAPDDDDDDDEDDEKGDE